MPQLVRDDLRDEVAREVLAVNVEDVRGREAAAVRGRRARRDSDPRGGEETVRLAIPGDRVRGDLRGLAFLIELIALDGRAKLPNDPVFSVLKY